MPVPFLLIGAAAATGIFGVGKNIQAVVRSQNAKSIIAEAQNIYDDAKQRLDAQRDITSADLD